MEHLKYQKMEKISRRTRNWAELKQPSLFLGLFCFALFIFLGLFVIFHNASQVNQLVNLTSGNSTWKAGLMTNNTKLVNEVIILQNQASFYSLFIYLIFGVIIIFMGFVFFHTFSYPTKPEERAIKIEIKEKLKEKGFTEKEIIEFKKLEDGE